MPPVSAQGFHLLPITGTHLEALRHLDVPHEDPFDRLLFATAIAEQCIFLTRDAPMRAFGLAFVEPG
jgi:PIN domain nuclease of toxin-antitoxin system